MKRDIKITFYLLKKFFRKHFMLITAIKVAVKILLFFFFYN
jgi:hypothetical protein